MLSRSARVLWLGARVPWLGARVLSLGAPWLSFGARVPSLGARALARSLGARIPSPRARVLSLEARVPSPGACVLPLARSKHARPRSEHDVFRRAGAPRVGKPSLRAGVDDPPVVEPRAIVRRHVARGAPRARRRVDRCAADPRVAHRVAGEDEQADAASVEPGRAVFPRVTPRRHSCTTWPPRTPRDRAGRGPTRRGALRKAPRSPVGIGSRPGRCCCRRRCWRSTPPS